MWSQSTLLGLVLTGVTAADALAQTPGSLRWPGATQTPLQVLPYGPSLNAGCGAISSRCEADTASAPLWTSANARRALLLEVGQLDAPPPRYHGLKLSVVGRAGLPHDLGVYGRVGTYLHRSGLGLHQASITESSGVLYGMGMSWDFSPQGSATMGLDGYDLRPATGDWRASLGLRWRY